MWLAAHCVAQPAAVLKKTAKNNKKTMHRHACSVPLGSFLPPPPPAGICPSPTNTCAACGSGTLRARHSASPPGGGPQVSERVEGMCGSWLVRGAPAPRWMLCSERHQNGATADCLVHAASCMPRNPCFTCFTPNLTCSGRGLRGAQRERAACASANRQPQQPQRGQQQQQRRRRGAAAADCRGGAAGLAGARPHGLLELAVRHAGLLPATLLGVPLRAKCKSCQAHKAARQSCCAAGVHTGTAHRHNQPNSLTTVSLSWLGP